MRSVFLFNESWDLNKKKRGGGEITEVFCDPGFKNWLGPRTINRFGTEGGDTCCQVASGGNVTFMDQLATSMGACPRTHQGLHRRTGLGDITAMTSLIPSSAPAVPSAGSGSNPEPRKPRGEWGQWLTARQRVPGTRRCRVCGAGLGSCCSGLQVLEETPQGRAGARG